MDEVKIITARNQILPVRFSFQISTEYIRVTLKAFCVACVDVSYQFAVKSRAMLLGKTLLNYYLWSCLCSWYKTQDWFHMPAPEQGEHAPEQDPLLFPGLCVLWKERRLRRDTGQSEQLHLSLGMQSFYLIFLACFGFFPS